MKNEHNSNHSLGLFFSQTRNMNDELKMQVLRIYFQHWGHEQTRIRKAMVGIHKTMSLLQQNFKSVDNMAHMDMRDPSFWTHVTEAFLPNMIHYLPYDDLGDLRMLYLRVRFADAIGCSFFFPPLVNSDEDQIRRINALIALPCL